MYFVVPAWRAGIPFFFSVRLKGEFGKRLCDVVRSLVLNIATSHPSKVRHVISKKVNRSY